MKNHLLLVFSLLFISTSVLSQYSDLKEYGLKGNVKSVNDAVYTEVKLMRKRSKIDSTAKVEYHKYMHFNPSGQMDTMKVIDLDEKDSLFNSIYVLTFEDGIKNGCTLYDSQYEPIEYMQIQWVDERTYNMAVTDTKGELVYESTSWLSSKFQDSIGETMIYNGGELVRRTKYVNRFGKRYRVVGVDYFDSDGGFADSEVIEYLEFDKKGNWIKCVVRDTFTGEYKKMTIRTIEYY